MKPAIFGLSICAEYTFLVAGNTHGALFAGAILVAYFLELLADSV